MKHLAVFAEEPPANFVEWWQAHTGCPDVFAAHVAWQAVKRFLSEVNAKAEASMLVNGGEFNQAHGVAILRLMQTFHSAPVNNPVNNYAIKNAVSRLATTSNSKLRNPAGSGELRA